MISIIMNTAIEEIANTKLERKTDVLARLSTMAAVEVMLMSPDEIDVAIKKMNPECPRPDVNN